MRPWLATCRCWHNNINNPNVPKPNLKTPRKQEPVRTPDHSRRLCLSFHQLFLQTLNLHRKGIATLSGSRLDLNLDCISVYQLYQRAPRQHLSLSLKRFMFLLLDLVAERVVQGLQVHQSLSLHVSFQVLQIFIPQSPSLVSFSIHLKFCILKAALQLLLRSLQALDTSGQHAAHAARAQQSFAPVPSPGQGPARVTECNRCGHYSQLGTLPADTCCIFCGSGRLHLTHQALHISTIFNY